MKSNAKISALQRLARLDSEVARKTLEKQAQPIFERLKRSDNYNELLEDLEALEKFVFRVPEQAFKVLNEFLNRLKVEELEYPEEYLKRYAANLRIKALDLIFVLRFMNVEGVSAVLLNSVNDEEKEFAERAKELLKNLAQYDLRAIEKLGYFVQQFLVERIENIEAEDLLKNLDTYMEVCRAILSPTAEATSSDYKTVTWHTATLPINDHLIEVRHRAIDLLCSFYTLNEAQNFRPKLFDYLRLSSSLPHQTDYGEEWVELVNQDFKRVVDFYMSIFDEADFLAYEDMEHHIYWMEKRGHKFAGQNFDTLNKLKQSLSKNDEYQVFKIIFGDERSYASYWADADWDYKKVRDYRHKKIDEYIALAKNVGDLKEWKARFLSFSKSANSNNSGSFEQVSYFLKNISKKFPAFGRDLLQELSAEQERFMPALLWGVSEGDLGIALSLANSWIDGGENLRVLLRCSDVFEKDQVEIIKKSVLKALDKNDVIALQDSLSALVQYHKDSPNEFIDLFVRAVKTIAAEGKGWADYVWYRDEAPDFVNALSEEQIDFLLETLLEEERLDTHEEYLLSPIAKKFPDKLIGYFYNRVKIQMNPDRKDDFKNYDAIPYSFYKLHESLSQYPDVVLPEIFDWHKEDKEQWLFRYDGARLVSILYPGLPEVLQEFLIRKIQQGSVADCAHAIKITREYDGNPNILPVCFEAIKKHPNDEGVMSEVVVSLNSSGVVSGEFGFRDAYLDKYEFVEEMEKSNNKEILEFSKKYKENLDKNVEFETERAEKDIAARKKLWGSKKDEE